MDVTDDGGWVLFAGNYSEPYEHPGIQRDNGKRSFAEIVIVDTRPCDGTCILIPV